MKVVLSVRNTSKVTKPIKDSVIIYDGEEWYVTTKEQLFKDFHDLYSKCNEKLETLEKQNLDFKKEISSQIKEMADLVEKLLKLKGDNL